jgi:hypothetical protein
LKGRGEIPLAQYRARILATKGHAIILNSPPARAAASKIARVPLTICYAALPEAHQTTRSIHGVLVKEVHGSVGKSQPRLVFNQCDYVGTFIYVSSAVNPISLNILFHSNPTSAKVIPPPAAAPPTRSNAPSQYDNSRNAPISSALTQWPVRIFCWMTSSHF